jgi:hypothetical protein
MKLSILRADEVFPDLRLRSMHNPEKKDSTIYAIAEGAIWFFFCLDIHGEKVLQ